MNVVKVRCVFSVQGWTLLLLSEGGARVSRTVTSSSAKNVCLSRKLYGVRIIAPITKVVVIEMSCVYFASAAGPVCHFVNTFAFLVCACLVCSALRGNDFAAATATIRPATGGP